MSMVALESSVFDPRGSIVMEATPDSSLNASTRRVSRTATLDGQAALIDNGWTAADSTLTIEAYLTEAEEAIVQHLVRVYPEVICSTMHGCYSGAIEAVTRTAGGRTAISYLIQRDMTQEPRVLAGDIPAPPEPPEPPEPTVTTGWVIATNSVGALGSVRRIWDGASSAVTLPANVRPGYPDLRSIPMASNGVDKLVLPTHVVGASTALGTVYSSNRAASFTGDGYAGNWLGYGVVPGESRSYRGHYALGAFVCLGFRTALEADPNSAFEDVWERMVFSASGTYTGDAAQDVDKTYSGLDDWTSATDMVEFDGKLFVVTAVGPGGYRAMPILAATPNTDLSDAAWSVVSSGYSSGLALNQPKRESWLATDGECLCALSSDGQQRYSRDGYVWTIMAATGISACQQLAAGNGWFVTLDDTPGLARIWAAHSDDFVWQSYDIPDAGFGESDQLWAVTFGMDRFCVVGSKNLAVTFAAPGTFTPLATGFDASATLAGVAFIYQET